MLQRTCCGTSLYRPGVDGEMIDVVTLFPPLLAVALAAGPGLDGLREEVHGSDGASDDAADSDDDDDFDLGCIFLCADEDDGPGATSGGHGPGWSIRPFAAFPYADLSSNYDPGTRADLLRTRTRAVLISAQAEGSYLTSGIWRATGGVRVQSVYRMGLATRWSYLSEHTLDHLWIGTAHIEGLVVRSPRIHATVAVGPQFFFDPVGALNETGGNAYGADAQIRVDALPVRPLALSICGGAGFLGRAPTWQVRAQAGVMLARVEILGGYEHMQVGKVALSGPVFGLRLWI